MFDTGYSSERDQRHQVAVREFVEMVNRLRGFSAVDIQDDVGNRDAPDVAVNFCEHVICYVDPKTHNDEYNYITIKHTQREYHKQKEIELGIPILYAWKVFAGIWTWRLASNDWLDSHRRGEPVRQPTGNGSKTCFGVYGPVSRAPLAFEMLGDLSSKFWEGK